MLRCINIQLPRRSGGFARDRVPRDNTVRVLSRRVVVRHREAQRRTHLRAGRVVVGHDDSVASSVAATARRVTTAAPSNLILVDVDRRLREVELLKR